MGRIRIQSVKRVGEKLLNTDRKQFTTKFKENKAKVAELTNVQTKKLRNLIAGYITKKMKVGE